MELKRHRTLTGTRECSTDLVFFREDSDVISLGADDLCLDKSFLDVRNPTVLLAIERLVLLLLHLLLVRSQVLVVRIIRSDLLHRHLRGWKSVERQLEKIDVECGKNASLGLRRAKRLDCRVTRVSAAGNTGK